MPELPDVEVYRRYFAARALHQRIAHTHVAAPRLLLDTSPQGLGRALSGHRFEHTRRHGKYFFGGLDSGRWLVLHFGMTGRLEYFKGAKETPRYTQLLIEFDDDARLAYVAPRKLGKIAIADDVGAFVAARKLGPDALGLELDDFRQLAEGRRGAVKSWLMNQKHMAGIGNVYADEMLYQARIKPQRSAADLDPAELKRLFASLGKVLRGAVEARADPDRMPESWLLPQRRKGGRCPTGGEPLETTRIGVRTTYYCPRHQK